LLRWFATYNVVWLPQEVRVDCKKIIVVWIAEKTNTYYSSLQKRKNV
jgi:hypothetical protein